MRINNLFKISYNAPVSSSIRFKGSAAADIVEFTNAPKNINVSEVMDDTFSEKYLSELEKMGLLKLTGTHYIKNSIDLTDETSKKTACFLKGKKGTLRTMEDVRKEFKLPAICTENIDFPTYEFTSVNNDYDKSLTFVELTDEVLKSLEEWQIKYLRTKRKPVHKYLVLDQTCAGERYIPATYLKKLGFYSVKGLTRLVQEGKLTGIIKEQTTSDGIKQQAYIDLKDFGNYTKLLKLREKNPNTKTLSEFAKLAGVTQKKVLLAVMNSDVDIIQETIFASDLDHIYIDLTKPKNKQFCEQCRFEQELIKQIKEAQAQQTRKDKEAQRIQNKDINEKLQSLKMKLVWYFCPDTKKTASIMASSDGYLCKLLIKDSEDETLTPNEQRKVNSYRKNMWLKAGTQELKEGFKKANEIIELIKSSGIDSIEDENIKQIIRMYFED